MHVLIVKSFCVREDHKTRLRSRKSFKDLHNSCEEFLGIMQVV